MELGFPLPHMWNEKYLKVYQKLFPRHMLICDIFTVQLAKVFQIISFTTCCFYTNNVTTLYSSCVPVLVLCYLVWFVHLMHHWDQPKEDALVCGGQCCLKGKRGSVRIFEKSIYELALWKPMFSWDHIPSPCRVFQGFILIAVNSVRPTYMQANL